MRVISALKNATRKWSFGKKSADSTLRGMLPSGVYALIKTRCTDWRLLTKTAAEFLGVSEPELCSALAARIKLPFLARINAGHISVFPEGLTLSKCRELGFAPICNEQSITAVALIEPSKKEEIFRFTGEKPVFLSPWSSIAQALDRYESSARRPKLVPGVESSLERSAAEALKAIVTVCERFGRHSAQIFFSGESATYSFTASDGEIAEGAINEQIKNSLVKLLDRYFLAEIDVLELQGGSTRRVEVTTKRTDQGRTLYGLTWGEESGLNEEPLLVCMENRGVEKGGATPADVISSAPESKSESAPNLLLVEDNYTFAQVLERFFSKQEMTTLHAESGAKALQLLSEGKVPDLILCDLHMPEMNGSEFLRNLRADHSLQDVPLIILTSDDSKEAELGLMELGADGYILKSEDPRLLALRVKRLASYSSRRRAA
ncbi:MAG: response regulator [Deltaproteobacteria bacterium]|nr:response regulator [Deltaproteobacteria bacterium]